MADMTDHVTLSQSQNPPFQAPDREAVAVRTRRSGMRKGDPDSTNLLVIGAASNAALITIRPFFVRTSEVAPYSSNGDRWRHCRPPCFNSTYGRNARGLASRLAAAG